MLHEFLIWWGRQLTSLVPDRLKAMIARLRPRLVLRLMPVSSAVFVVEAMLHRRSGIQTLGVFDLTEDGIARLRQATEQAARLADVTLQLDDGSVLERDLTLPSAVQRSLQQALAYEFDHETPFRPDEVYWTAEIVKHDRINASLSVRLAMILKRRLDPVLELLRKASLSPRRVTGEGVFVRLPRSNRKADRENIPILVGGAVAALLLLAVILPFIGQSIAFSHVEARIARLQPVAGEVQSLRKQLGDDLREQQVSMGDPLVMLAALTDILPDDTRLVGLSLHDRTLELIGQSSASSLLIGRLAKSPGFQNPTFSAPVTRPENTTEDTFSIKVQYTQ